MSLRLLGIEFAATLWGLWARPQNWIFMDIWEKFLGFSRILTTPCEIFQGNYGILGGICQVYMLDAAKKPGNLRDFRGYFRKILRIPAMRPNRPTEEGDGTGWGLVSATATLLIPEQFPINIGIGNSWGSVSATVTLWIPKPFPIGIGIGIGNFWEINSNTISYR